MLRQVYPLIVDQWVLVANVANRVDLPYEFAQQLRIRYLRLSTA